MQVAIISYDNSASIDIYDLPDGVDQIEDVEEWLENEHGYKVRNTEFIFADKLLLNDYRKTS